MKLSEILPNRMVGLNVRSLYRARWYGRVIGVERRKGFNPLVTVRRERDRCGRPMRKPDTVVLDSSWLEVLPS